MNEFDELERLFAAERQTTPPPAATERGRAKLGAAIAAGAPGLTLGTGPLKFGVAAGIKWLAIGVSTLALGGGGAVLAARTSVAPSPEAASTSTVSAMPSALAPPPPTAAEPLPPPEKPPPEKPVASAPSGRSASPTFDEELRLIQLAKSELDAGRSHLARVWLEEHRTRFSKGVFATERDALVLLIDCPAGAGATRARAEAFVRNHRESPMVDRIVRACGLEVEAALPSGKGEVPVKSPNGGGTHREPTGTR